MGRKTLNQIVGEQPFPDYAEWWRMGVEFTSFMSKAIVSQWSDLHNSGNLGVVKDYVSAYSGVVYGRKASASLVEDFVNKPMSHPIQSGEFDALSYSFYRSAFELIEKRIEAYDNPLERERRLFTKRVGKEFFGLVHNHLTLDLPANLSDVQSFVRLKDCIQQVGAFLKTQGYLRDHFNFSFAVDIEHAGLKITQTDASFLADLQKNGIGYALYEMGYAVILPSAVYLYHTIGEAQHHSSRTIEELFDLIGYEARETDDFDPTGYPADMVVELWEIRKLA
jgi:hypothetical protein